MLFYKLQNNLNILNFDKIDNVNIMGQKKPIKRAFPTTTTTNANTNNNKNTPQQQHNPNHKPLLFWRQRRQNKKNTQKLKQ